MRNLTITAMLALATPAFAQSLSTLTGGVNQGNIGGGMYFDLTVNTTVTLTSLSFLTGANTVAGTNAFVDVYLGPNTYLNNVTNAGLWTKVGSTAPATVIAGSQMVTANIVPVPQITAVTIAPGTYGIALKSNNHNHGYTNGVTCTSVTLPGSCANSLFSNAQLTIRGGAAQNVFLTGGVFAPRIFNGTLTYTLGGTPITFAVRQPYGNGCYLKTRSFYEFWPSSTTVDVANTSMRLTYDGANNRYNPIFGGTTAPIAPVSPSLGHLDDNNITVPLLNAQPIIFAGVGGPGIVVTSVEMSSNGYINLTGTNAATANPSVAAFLTGTPRVGTWHDYDPSGASYTPAATGATTNYDYDLASGSHVFTWFNCPDSFRTIGVVANRSTFQMAFFANGDIEFRWGSMVLGGGQYPTLIGFTNGGSAVDPGSRDLTASFPFSTDSIDQAALKLVGDVNPVLGQTVQLTTSGETGMNIGLCFVTLSDLPGFSPVGLDLGILGAGGCVANVDINQGVGNVNSNLGLPGVSMVVPFPIPAGPPSILGLSFFCQSAWLDSTQNAAGLLTSNALRLKVGSF